MALSARRLPVMLKAFYQLGPKPLALYGWYQLGLRAWLARPAQPQVLPAGLRLHPFLRLPPRDALREVLGVEGAARLLAEAAEIEGGQVRLFGGAPVPLQLEPPGPLAHWTAYERGVQPWGAEDVKFIWEPARFSWAFTLARAYHLTADDRWAQAFWDLAGRFLAANPVGLGPNWASAQEVALRLVALVFAGQVFLTAPSSTHERLEQLVSAIAEHAGRIPSTLAYARSQQNNHLLTEAAGLYTAAAALPAHPSAPRWKRTGWRWFNRGLSAQVASDGAYAQHSTNYHRLVLQAALWMDAVAAQQGDAWPAQTSARLAAAARWLLALLDPLEGRVPNLGPNDGANILPLSSRPFSDFRPALSGAGTAFLGKQLFPAGPWDEPALWLAHDRPPDLSPPVTAAHQARDQSETPHVLRGPQSWAYFRAARFTSRPGHADQLHVDLWWRGLNVAQDAGTYLYNAPPPWQNALAHTDVHNTITLKAQDQMQRAGRFLWLDWAQAQVHAYDPAGKMVAEHNGYARFGAVHRRRLERKGDSWTVTDEILPAVRAPQTVTLRLHWLLPDWPWLAEAQPGSGSATLRLQSPDGWLAWEVECPGCPAHDESRFSPALVRAGKTIWGAAQAARTWGWASPTYGQLIPALSFSVEVKAPLPVVMISRFCPPGAALASE